MTNSEKSPQTILVTGAAGFIGGHLSEHLMRRGDRVVGVDLVNDYYNPAFKNETLTILENYSKELGPSSVDSSRPRFTFYQVDMCEVDKLTEVFKKEGGKFDVVVHLAAQAGVRFSVDNPVSVIHTNITGTQVVFDVSREFKVPYIVAASSSSVYGTNFDFKV